MFNLHEDPRVFECMERITKVFKHLAWIRDEWNDNPTIIPPGMLIGMQLYSELPQPLKIRVMSSLPSCVRDRLRSIIPEAFYLTDN